MSALKKTTRQRATHSKQAQEPSKDVVLSAMLAQISICIVLLALAYFLKLSGLPAYLTTRTAIGGVLNEELYLGGLKTALTGLDIKLPEVIDEELAGYIEKYLPSTTLVENESTTAASASTDVSNSTEASAEIEPYTDFDIETATDEEALLPEGLIEDEWEVVSNIEEPLMGQGGGFNFVKKTNDEKRLETPKTAILSPFFISEKPELPVKLGTLTCAFGYRKHPITGQDDFHTGVDIAAPNGSPISAVLGGTVSEVGSSSIYGNYIVVRHSTGLETAYCHCSEVLAPIGAVVKQREVIAKVGSTGVSTGNHVHLEFRLSGMRANPAWVYDEF